MTTYYKIRQLFTVPSYSNFGFTENEILEAEKKLNIILPVALREYYLSLGKHELLNYAHNRLLTPDEISFSPDRYVMIYEENQGVANWGIKVSDLGLAHPPVWGNYGSEEDPDWHLEAKTTEDFFLLMAVYNGTFGGLKYHANAFEEIEPAIVRYIEDHWELVEEISSERQKIFTDSYHEVISLSFDEENNCEGIFLGTNHQDRFDKILDRLDIDWSYISYEDEDIGEDDSED